MKVCIPFGQRSIGGPVTFARKFGRALATRQIEIVNTFSGDCDVLLAIVSAPLQDLLQARRCGVPILQRLDGVYYPAVSGRRWWIQNLPIWITYRFFANRVVFQSEYSQRMCERFLGQPRCPTSIIYNGVNLNLFTPDGEVQKLAEGTILLCLLATFWRQSEILPVVEAFDRLRMQYRNSQLVVVGRFVPSIQHIPSSRPDILWMGQIPNQQLPVVYRGADLMLSAKLRAPCPNAVIEAMACGLPIACFESGAHWELIGDEAGICVPLNDDFGPFPDLNGAALADAGGHVLQNRSKFASGARWRAEQHFGLDQMVERYLAVFREVIGLRGD
jgi:glycosyltransferase involved in cell wall biosynthesis